MPPITGLPRTARRLASHLFYQFGIHCATNQIRVILISAVVITSLFYPALAIYFSSQPLAHLSSQFLNPLLSSSGSSHSSAFGVRNIWDGYDSLRVRVDAAAQARCGVERTIRLERILLPRATHHVSSMLHGPTLLSTLELQNALSASLHQHGSCLRSGDDCFVLSPLSYWHNDETVLSSNLHLEETFNVGLNVTALNIPMHSSMVLTGRDVDSYENDLVLTYFFIDNDCQGKSEHSAWIQTVIHACAELADAAPSSAPPTLMALEYQTDHSDRSFSMVSALLYLTYLIVFVYFSGSFQRMDTVHSRFGLAFTGIVEILASTITSISVCAIWGFRITMVPWGILPIVIVFVGAENMFVMVEAVVSTSISLPVKERIAVGLSKAGTSISLKVVSYNCVLGTIAALSSGAIRQFCSFAIVVLVAHWFLIHTLFLAVLSIDLQRLELDDLLRQGTNIQAPVPPVASRGPSGASKTYRGRAMEMLRSMLKGKAARNWSLILLLTITGGLYYVTYPHPEKSSDSYMGASVGADVIGKATQLNVQHSATDYPASQIWHFLNPTGDPLLHIRVESPIVVTLHSNTNESRFDSAPEHANSLRVFRRKMRPIWWTTKIIFLPIFGTTGSLYLLLLYLLKDAELLEAQLHRLEKDIDLIPQPNPVKANIAFSTLPRAFASDVELISANGDGSVIVSVSLDNECVVWFRRNKTTTHTAIDCVEALNLERNNSVVTHVTVDPDGEYCALGSDNGSVGVWRIDRRAEGVMQAEMQSGLDGFSSAVSGLAFMKRKHHHPTSVPGPPVNGHANHAPAPSAKHSLLVVFMDGTAIEWDFRSPKAYVPITPSLNHQKLGAWILVDPADTRPYLAFNSRQGGVELMSFSDADVDGQWGSVLDLPAGNAQDLVDQVRLITLQVAQESRRVIAAATESGKISLWDGASGESIGSFDKVEGRIEELRLALSANKPCQHCGELSADGFTLAFSVNQLVQVYRASTQLQAGRCSCPSTVFSGRHNASPMRGSTFRSRSGSISSTSTSSPVRPRVNLPALSHTSPTLNLAPEYPMSAHGVHSRRLSGVETNRRQSTESDKSLSSDGWGSLADGDLTFDLRMQFVAPDGGTSVWHTVRLDRVGAVACDRGAWDVVGSTIMGIRRTSRARDQKPKQIEPPSRLTTTASRSSTMHAALERWELWTLDPSSKNGPVFCSSTLSTILDRSHDGKRALGNGATSCSAQAGSLLLKRQANFQRFMGASQNSTSTSPHEDRTSLPPQSDIYPRLPFTRVMPLVVAADGTCISGFGNTVGLIHSSLPAAGTSGRDFSSLDSSPHPLKKRL
ncbi:hypothetical protein BOTBODRAFT_176534 [Botryobasidium botryosum FD-172 SS1]|uniref:Sterol regulatory element-binding protein cleavage-activating protein n=1 Tax=Botryobasidium botryosum (strain FD-172 SS1) TaxID=930990 RepID=A0A067MKB1_BOTB1|nr:hypothetical protein BOTBODRAFT_176534 [Botryobasidium botryosum FD-172 SS1]